MNNINIYTSNYNNNDSHIISNGIIVPGNIALKYNKEIFTLQLIVFSLILIIFNICYFIKAEINPNRYNVNISFIQMISAIGVFVVHSSQSINYNGNFMALFDMGRHGAEIFMVLSGYYIMFSLEKKHDIKKFFLARTLKIVPVYYAMLLISIIYMSFSKISLPYDDYGWIRYFCFFSTIIPADDNFWTNYAATWSIPCFVLFYLLCPFMHKYLNNYNKNVISLFMFFICTLVFNYMLYVYNIISVQYAFFPLNYYVYFLFGVTTYWANKQHVQKSYYLY